MNDMTLNTDIMTQPKESLALLLEEDLISSEGLMGSVVKGSVIKLENDFVIIDVGLKSEGRVPLREFSPSGEKLEIKVGDEVDVYLEALEDRHGQIVLSYEKARREAAWVELEKKFQANEQVKGIIFGKVKGGFTVDLDGAIAFLPGSQVDVRPIRDIDPLMGIDQPFMILKMDRARGNIVVSRRSVLEESRAEARTELISALKEGEILDGIVKNITDYGAFIDLGGMDGLLHVTDISWKRVNNPADVLEIGQNIKVQVVRFNPETQRISLGMKQLEEDPWVRVENKYPVDTKFEGTVTNVTDYGAFIELEEGIEGLAHVSDMSWTRKGAHPSQFVSLGQKVETMILSIDESKRRISLGLKQCVENPWKTLQDKFKVGSEHEGEVKNITEFGLFVGMTNDIDGMVHMSDISWDEPADEAIKQFKKNQKIKVKVLAVDPEKERVVLGIKQLSDDPFSSSMSKFKIGTVVTCEITAVQDSGLDVTIGDGIRAFIRKADLAKDRTERRTDRFAVGEKVDAKISSIDNKARRVTLSIKSREISEEKKVMAEYGSTDSGASLGDILGAAMSKAKEREKEAKTKDEKPAVKKEEKKETKAKAAKEEKEEKAKPVKAKKATKAAKAKEEKTDDKAEKKPAAKKTTKAKKDEDEK